MAKHRAHKIPAKNVRFSYSPHIKRRMKERGITAKMVRGIVLDPDFTQDTAHHKDRVKSVAENENGDRLIVVWLPIPKKIVAENAEIVALITCWRSS